MSFARWFSDEWTNAWRWLSVQLGAVIAIAPAVYENLDVVQDFVPRPYFAAAQGVLGALVMLNAVKKKAAWLSLCVACVAGEEGLRTVAYKDPVGIPTICFGETKDVKLGDSATVEQCKTMLSERVLEFGRGVDACTTVPLTPSRKASLTSFAYNVGVEGYCKSSIARKLNAGDVQGGCDALLLYVYAKGIKLPGLVKRREQERALCLA